IGSTWGGSSNVAGGSFVVGQTYVISAIGGTSFTAIGASANTASVVFTATGTGVGITGTAYSQIAIPWFPVGFASVHNTTGIGTQTAGAVISHGHTTVANSTGGGSTGVGTSGGMSANDPHSH